MQRFSKATSTLMANKREIMLMASLGLSARKIAAKYQVDPKTVSKFINRSKGA